MLVSVLLVAMQSVPTVADYFPGPWVVFTEARWRGDAPPIVADIAEAARRLPDTRLELCAEGVRGNKRARVAVVRRMLMEQGVTARRLRTVLCPDRDTNRPAGVRITIL